MPHPRLALALTTVLLSSTAAVTLTPTAANAAQTIGYPTFSGSPKTERIVTTLGESCS